MYPARVPLPRITSENEMPRDTGVELALDAGATLAVKLSPVSRKPLMSSCALTQTELLAIIAINIADLRIVFSIARIYPIYFSFCT